MRSLQHTRQTESGQTKTAIALLEHVVTQERVIMTDDHPWRLVAESMLEHFYEDLGKSSGNRYILDCPNPTAEQGQPFSLALKHI
jgi:hypothetical protein